MNRLRIGALVSGGGSNLQAVIDNCQNGTIDGEVVFVGADKPDAGGLERAGRYDIPTIVVDYSRIIRDYARSPEAMAPPDDFDLEEMIEKQSLFPKEADPARVDAFMVTRAIAEHQLLVAMADHDFDLLILAGFMRNLTPYFIDRVNTDPGRPRIMNIHPALLPAFPGVDGYGDTFRYGCKVGGCTVHFVDYGEDSGPIIGQRAFDILPGDDLAAIREKGLQQEWLLYSDCIQLYAENRLQVKERVYELPGGRRQHRHVVIVRR